MTYRSLPGLRCSSDGADVLAVFGVAERTREVRQPQQVAVDRRGDDLITFVGRQKTDRQKIEDRIDLRGLQIIGDLIGVVEVADRVDQFVNVQVLHLVCFFGHPFVTGGYNLCFLNFSLYRLNDFDYIGCFGEFCLLEPN